MKQKLIYLFSLMLMCIFGTSGMLAETVTAEWNWQNNVPEGIRDFTAIQNGTGTLESNVEGIELYVDATNGKLGPNGNNAQFNAGTILRVPVVSTKDVVTVTGYTNLSNYCFDNGEPLQNTNTYTANSFDVNRGYVEVISTTGGGYLFGVKVEQDKSAAATAFKNFAVQLTSDVFDTSVTKFGVKVASDGTYSATDFDASDATFTVNSARFNDAQHGWVNCTITLNVDGPVKIGLGGCQFGAQDGTITDSENGVTDITPLKTCWASNNIEGTTAYTTYKGLASTTLTIKHNGYLPYISVEAVDPTTLIDEATVSFAAGEAEGAIVPASQKKEVGKTITLPINYTMYVEGKTLTAWSDGTNEYAPGAEYTVPESDIELQPVFTENTVSLADRTEATTIKWNFRRDQGAPVVQWQNVNGNVWVAQATVGNATIDVPITVDTNPGKFNNANWTDLAQVNEGTKITIPSCKGAVVSMEAYANITTTTIDGQNDYTQGKTISYTVANTAESVDVVIGDGSYYRYIQVVLPVIESAGGKSYDNEAAKIVWAMTDMSNPGDYVATPAEAFSTVAFTYEPATITGTSNITDENAEKVLTGIKFKPAQGGSDVLKWNAKPVAGLTFTPTRVAGYVNRVGTDSENGITVSVYVEGSEGSATKLGTWTALRSGKTNSTTSEKNATSKAYDATAIYKYDITLTEAQQQALASSDGFYLTSTIGVGNSKEGAFGEVTIEGTINGVAADVNKYALTVAGAPENGGEVKKYPSAEVYEEGTEVTLTATPNFGYHFVNWTDAQGEVVSEEAKFTYTVNAEAALTANFTAVNTYELKYTVEGANDYMVQPTPAPEVVDGKKMYEEGTKVTLEASQYEGLVTFNNWSDGQTTGSITVDMNEDVDITAVYSQADIIAGWDFYKAGNNGRVADFAAADNEADALSLVKTGTTTTASWLDKSTEKGGGYESFKGAAVNWNTGAENGDVGNFHWQTKVNAEAFTDINVQFQMLYNYNAYQTYNAEYSLDGETWTSFGSVTMTGAKSPASFSEKLPAACNNQASLYIRMIADKTSNVDGTASRNDGNALAMFFITGTQQLVDDGTAPVLQSTVPAEGNANASANGKIVLTFDEKVKVAEGATATLNDLQLTPKVSGKTVVFEYKGLSYSTAYAFTLPANSVADLTDNYISEPITVNFTTRARPTVAKADYDFIVPDDGTITEALAAANARGTSNSERFRIFIKNGNYVFDTNGTTTGGDGNTYPDPRSHLSAPNVSFIGESMEGVTITNITPDATWDNGYGQACPLEGIGNGDVLIIDKTATNTYFQNLTIKTSMGDAHGRDIAVNDQSNRTIFKDASLWGYQDTYVSNNQNGKFYFEGGVLRGRTDYMCGKGDVYYNQVTLRQVAAGYAAVPSQPKKYGYIYQSCKIVGDADGVNGNYTLGRPWGQGTPIALFIDTEMEVAPSAIGWSEMSGGYPARFAEYNSHLTSGTVVDLDGRKTDFGAHPGCNNPVLTAEEAAEYTLATVMGQDDDWDPTELTEQAPSVQNVVLDGNVLSWDDSEYALTYAIVKNGSVVAFTTENTYEISDASASDTWAVRAANEMGGLNDASEATIVQTVVTLDESQGYTPVAAENVTVQLVRSISAGKWSTIVLPFAMTEAQLKDAFGENVKVAELVSGTESKLNFSYVTATEANKPYAIKVAAEDNYSGSATIENVTVVNGTPTQGVGNWSFVGVYDVNVYMPEGSYFFTNNKIKKVVSENTNKIKPFRAYFAYSGTNTQDDIDFSFDGVPTAIETLSEDDAKQIEGKFIVDGQLVVAKNGKLYNAAGAVIK